MLSQKSKDNNEQITEQRRVKDTTSGLSDKLEETNIDIDSGFLSGPQNFSSSDIETANKIDNNPSTTSTQLTSSEQKLLNTSRVQTLDSGLQDSGLILDEPDTEQQEEEKTSNNMIIDSIDPGLTEWFCNLSINNGKINDLTGKSTQKKDDNQMEEDRTESDVTIKNQSTKDTVIPYWQRFYQQDDEGDTYLHIAAVHGAPEVVNAIIQIAPDPLFLDIPNNILCTALHFAVIANKPDVVRSLLIGGANVTARDKNGNTPLHFACRDGHIACVRALTVPIQESEIVNMYRNMPGYRPRSAILPQNFELRNYEGEHCVHIATMRKHYEVLHYLVKSGADINAGEGKSGESPLHLAINSGDEKLVKFILENFRQELNIETLIYRQLTAYQCAAINNQGTIMRILENFGAKPLLPPGDSESEDDDQYMSTELDEEYKKQVTV